MSIKDYKQMFEVYIGWMLIFIFCLIPVILWIVINDIPEEFSTSYGAFSSTGQIFGLIGFVLYAVNLLLSVRHKWLENFFNGINQVYIAHHITGGLALAFVVFHPMFLTIRYIDIKITETFSDAATFLWFRSLDTTVGSFEMQQAIAVNAGIIAFWGMVVLVVITLFVKLPYRIWLFTHRFLGVAFAFALVHIFFISSDTSESTILKAYLVIWGLIGIVSYLYRTVFGSIFVKKSSYKVIKVKYNGTVTSIELIPLNKKINFNAGQFVYIKFLGNEDVGIAAESHPFSIASSSQNNSMKLYVKAIGDFTSSLKLLKPDSIAEVEGAFGRFAPANYGKSPQIWIAGGIGITPFLSMARSLHELPQKIHLIYIVKTRSELVEYSELSKNIPKSFKNFNFIPYVTDENKNKHIDINQIEKLSGGLEDREIFICGPPVMMSSFKSQLRSKNIPIRKIHSEEFAMS